MKTRASKLPETLRGLDESKLEYVDGWAYATTIMKEKCANVFFITNDIKDLNLVHGEKSIRMHQYIVVSLPKEYAITHEQFFKKGIKSTARQLVYDKHFEHSLKVIPTSFYVFDQGFMTLFTTEYELNVRRSKYSEESKQRFRNLLNDTKRNQLKTLNEYDEHIKELNSWNRALRTEKTLV